MPTFMPMEPTPAPVSPLEGAGPVAGPAPIPPEVAQLLATLSPEQLAALSAQLQAGSAQAAAPAPAGPMEAPAAMPGADAGMPPEMDQGVPPMEEGGAPAQEDSPATEGENEGGPAEGAEGKTPAEDKKEDAAPPFEKEDDKSEDKKEDKKEDSKEKEAMARHPGAYLARSASIAQKSASNLSERSGGATWLAKSTTPNYMARR